MLGLGDLQYRILKDPLTYIEDFRVELEHVKAILGVLQRAPTSANDTDAAVIRFLCVTCQLFVSETREAVLPTLLDLLENANLSLLSIPLLVTTVQLLHRFRGVGILRDGRRYLQVCFLLCRLRNKKLRTSLKRKLISEISKCSSGGRGGGSSLVRQYKSVLFAMARDPHKIVSKISYDILIALYHRHVWSDDDRVVNVIAEACTGVGDSSSTSSSSSASSSSDSVSASASPDTRILVTGLCFFLNEKPPDDDEEVNAVLERKKRGREMTNEIKAEISRFAAAHSRKTKKRKRQHQRTLLRLKRQKRDLEERPQGDRHGGEDGSSSGSLGLSLSAARHHQRKGVWEAIYLRLFDIDRFAQRLFAKLRSPETSNERFEVRLMLMRVIARAISVGNLISLPTFHTYLLQHLEPSYENATTILAIAAESVHRLLEPDEVVRPLITTIARRFLHDRSPPVSLAMGLNAIRLICERQPLGMTENLLGDIVRTYGRHKIRIVSLAARGITNVFRKVNPHLLPAAVQPHPNARTVEYGEQDVRDGAELLDEENEDESEEEGERDAERFQPVDEVRQVLLGKKRRRPWALDDSDEEADVLELLENDAGDDVDSQIADETPNYRMRSATHTQSRKKKNFMMIKFSTKLKNKAKLSSRQVKRLQEHTKARARRWKKKRRKRF